VFTNEPGYFTGFVLKLLPFRCYVVFPGKAFFEV
jgi:hypothetical protein